VKPLVEILRCHQEAIAGSLAARLEQSDCCRLAQTEPGRCQALLDALAAVAQEIDSPVAVDWAERLSREVERLDLTYADGLAVLRRLERAVRVQVVRLTTHRGQLLGLLNQLSNAVDTLRRAYTEASFAQPAATADEQQQRIAEALAESEARKRAILESSLDPIITVDAEGRITEFNRAAEVAFGRPRREVLGTKPSEMLFPDTRQKQQDRIDRYLAVGEGSLLGRRTEIVAARASGETFDAELAMTLSMERGQPVMTFFVRDISQRKRAEADQARYRAELERSNRELERFAYVVSHDLQEPLRKIRVFGARLATGAGATLDETPRQDLDRITDAAQRMERLIEGLLQFSRVAIQPQRFEPVDLNQVATEVVADLQARVEETGAKVEVGPLPRLDADPLQMRQLLQNLVGNALKFRHPERGPVVRVRCELLERDSESDHAPEPWCRLSVHDNGIGFELHQAERIFGLFQRLHAREAYEGTGVGLAICRKIVERHGGTISAHAKPDDGATFEVLLPLTQPDVLDHA
jgi:two-component system sensor kinase FixL